MGRIVARLVITLGSRNKDNNITWLESGDLLVVDVVSEGVDFSGIDTVPLCT